LILRENGMKLDTEGFQKELQGQKNRSREDGTINAGDWKIIRDSDHTLFTGYEKTEDEVLISKYRTIKIKGKDFCQLVFNKTPFYAESGGQVGDSGYILSDNERIEITDTIKENDLILHIAKKAPADPLAQFKGIVDIERRQMTSNNHTATHIIHYALRAVLGKHVEQKGSLVTPERLRFDFSHYNRISREELTRIEMIANKIVRENHRRKVTDNISLKKAKAMGAIALFGEKYGENVRVVEFGNSVELCGGTHVDSTSNIGIVKIISEGAIAAGIRRIEAVTAGKADEYISNKLADAEDAVSLLKTPGPIREGVEKLLAENNSMKKSLEKYQMAAAVYTLRELETKAINIKNIRYISGQIESDSPEILKTIAFEVRKSSDNSVLVIGSALCGKANIVVMVSDKLVRDMNINAVEIIKEIAPEINGGGGGQPFLATAGGKNPDGIKKAVKKAEEYLKRL
jgi:alanyl-tRNA synthetase